MIVERGYNIRWTRANTALPTNRSKTTSSRPLCPPREFCNCLIQFASIDILAQSDTPQTVDSQIGSRPGGPALLGSNSSRP